MIPVAADCCNMTTNKKCSNFISSWNYLRSPSGTRLGASLAMVVGEGNEIICKTVGERSSSVETSQVFK